MREETFALLAYQMALHKVTLRKELHIQEGRPQKAETEMPQTGSPRVYGNPGLLQQAFTDLIFNACQSMPQGGTLTVASRLTEAGQASSRGFVVSAQPNGPARGVEIRFRDTGRGIPSERLSKIFAPFFTTRPVGKGMGLGLSTSYSIIQQHQGTIEVESWIDEGTVFIVWLPICVG